MALAVLPLAISAAAGYLMLDHGVIAAYRDVAARQRNLIDPAQRLQIALLEADDQIGDYLATDDLAHLNAYRGDRKQIEADFVRLHGQLAAEPDAQMLVERARSDWSEADRVVSEEIDGRKPAGDAASDQTMARFEGLIRSSVDKLSAVYADLDRNLGQDYLTAHLAYDHAEWLAVSAAIVSALLILAGVIMFGRLIRGSVDRLVEGANLFAAGDRSHRIEVQVPPELRKVAIEFNHMIEQIHQAEDVLAERARHDELTGLLNRRAFDEAIAEAFARMERLDEQLAVLMIDLDHFKHINDTYGHAVGDGVLTGVTKRIVSSLRTIDRVYRVGGEELVVMLPGADGVAAQALAERIRGAIGDTPLLVDGQDIPVTISIGVALASSPHPGRVAALMKCADEALYQAKNGGRNRVVLADQDGFETIRAQLTHKKTG